MSLETGSAPGQGEMAPGSGERIQRLIGSVVESLVTVSDTAGGGAPMENLGEEGGVDFVVEKLARAAQLMTVLAAMGSAAFGELPENLHEKMVSRQMAQVLDREKIKNDLEAHKAILDRQSYNQLLDKVMQKSETILDELRELRLKVAAALTPALKAQREESDKRAAENPELARGRSLAEYAGIPDETPEEKANRHAYRAISEVFEDMVRAHHEEIASFLGDEDLKPISIMMKLKLALSARVGESQYSDPDVEMVRNLIQNDPSFGKIRELMTGQENARSLS